MFLSQSSVIQCEISDYNTSSSSLLFLVTSSQADVAGASNASTLMAGAICSRQRILPGVFLYSAGKYFIAIFFACMFCGT